MKEKLKLLPKSPGVYMMHDAQGNIIYVGKAKNLKNRVSQYFHNNKDRDPRVNEMIQHIHAFNYQVTDTELDALIEECRLIKEIQPLFNRQMKNDQKYCYIKLANEPFPKLTVINQKSDDGSLYYGPFTSMHRVEKAVQFLNDFYPLRKCTSHRFVEREYGCLFKQIGTCLGVCTGQVGRDEYWAHLDRMGLLLNGKDKAPVEELSQQLNNAIENLQFEKAAQYREFQLGLKHVMSKQRLVHVSSKGSNIIAIESLDNEQIKLFLIKGNKLLQRIVFNRELATSFQIREYLNQIIKNNFCISDYKKTEKLSQHDVDEAQIISSYLTKNKSRIISYRIPAKQLKNKDSLDDTVNKILSQILAGIRTNELSKSTP